MEKAKFEETLARGIEAEDQVYTWLKMHYSYVQDMRYQVHGKSSGPRLEGQYGYIVLPDFAIYDRFFGNILVDVKAKTSVYTINGKKYFTVDDKFDDYNKCVGLLRADKLMLVFVYNNKMYFYDADENKGIHKFDNTYGKNAYLFEYSESKVRQ